MSVGGNAFINGSNSSSNSQSFNESETFAKEVVERAMERVVKKSSYKRTSRMLREFEENNKHGFDNRKGDKHVTGIYRWVDKIYNNKLVNYGKRLTYEFAIPEPSKSWKELMLNEITKVYKPKAPKTPYSPPSKSTNIDKYNYAEWAGKFGIEVPECPAKLIYVGKSYAEMVMAKDPYQDGDLATSLRRKGAFKYNDIEIPEGYECSSAKVDGGYHNQKNDQSPSLKIHVGQTDFTLWSDGSNFYGVSNQEKNLPVSIRTKDVATFNYNVTAKCERKTETYTAWQSQVYMLIKEAYYREYEEYLNLYAQWEAEINKLTPVVSDSTDYNNNPLLNRRIEQTELKKTAIQYMLSQSGQKIGQNFRNQSDKNCSTHVFMTEGLSDYSEIIRFVEDAIDWNLMSYTFHPYFWANCNDDTWQKLLRTTSNTDSLFEAFLQAGFANVKVPIKGGYEAAILFFLDTGRIWKDGDVAIDGKDGVYNASLMNLDLKSADSVCCECSDDGDTNGEGDCKCGPEEEECVEAKWTSRVPTTLIVVQDYSAPLDANGLPCFSKNDPKVKFCEDGTPLGGLDTESEDPDNGLMVGQSDSALNPTALVTGLQNLIQAGIPIAEAISQLIENFNGGGNKDDFDCDSLNNDYQNYLDSYDSFISATDLTNCKIAVNTRNTLKAFINDFQNLIDNGQGNCDVLKIEATLSDVKTNLETLNTNCPI